MAESSNIFLAIGLILFIGIFCSFIVGFFIDYSSVEVSPLVSPLLSVIEYDGLDFDFFGLFDVNLNPFSWLGGTLNTYLSNSLIFFSLFPSWLIAIVMILCTFSFIVLILNLVRGI